MAWCNSLWPDSEDLEHGSNVLLANGSCPFCRKIQGIQMLPSDQHIVQWDIILAVMLAFCSLVANLGVLCLAKITTRRGSLKSHLSESSIVAASNLRVRKLSEAHLKNVSLSYSEIRTRRLSTAACLDYSVNQMSPPNFSKEEGSFFADNNEKPAEKKVARFQIMQQSFTSLSEHFKQNQTNRGGLRSNLRNRRYLRGLLVIAISNLTITCCLILWSIREILMRLHGCREIRAWFDSRMLIQVPFFDIITEDTAQAVEIGAVLWIALERTMAIQWPAKRRSSSASCTSPTSPNMVRLSSSSNFEYRKYEDNESSSNCWHEVCCYFGEYIQTRRNSSNLSRRHSDEPFLPQSTQRSFIFSKRFKSTIRILLCILPFILLLSSYVASAGNWSTHLNTVKNKKADYFINQSVKITTAHERFHYPYFYFNSIILSMLIFGQFLIPFCILLITSILIYHRVATRDRPFSRQSSNTSKSSSISNPPMSKITTIDEVKRKKCRAQSTQTPPNLPELRLITNSNSKLHLDLELIDSPGVNPTFKLPEVDRTKLCPRETILNVPLEDKALFETNNSNRGEFLQLNRSKFDECRRSISSLVMALKSEKKEYFEYFNKQNSDDLSEIQPMLFATPQPRRKSSADILMFTRPTSPTNLTRRRETDPVKSNTNGENSMEALLCQLMRNQHRRTWRILVVLLLVFIVCRAPKTIILIIGWLNKSSFCERGSALKWLNYASLWAHTSTILDPIVYGFWGNRAYRTRLQQWSQSFNVVFCSKRLWKED